MTDSAPETPPVRRPATNPLVKLAIEAGPLAVFFITNAKLGIFVATGAFMAAITVSLVTSWLLTRHLPPMALFTAVFVLIFGGLTIWLEDEIFIKLKPTIVNSLFAIILALGLAFRKLLLKHAFGDAIRMTEEGWRAMTVRWIGFFAFLAIVNEVVWRNVSTDTWVSFKVFGIMPLTLVFSMTLVPLMTRHQLPEDDGGAGSADAKA